MKLVIHLFEGIWCVNSEVDLWLKVMEFRVVYRPSSLLRTVLTFNYGLVICESAPDQNNSCRMDIPANGIAVLIGESSEGCVMRPVTDVMNN
jgi:hypothetical protein